MRKHTADPPSSFCALIKLMHLDEWILSFDRTQELRESIHSKSKANSQTKNYEHCWEITLNEWLIQKHAHIVSANHRKIWANLQDSIVACEFSALARLAPTNAKFNGSNPSPKAALVLNHFEAIFLVFEFWSRQWVLSKSQNSKRGLLNCSKARFQKSFQSS